MLTTQDLYTKNHLATYTGRLINILDPNPMDIFPMDIAMGLARACRFAGHTKSFYSVAEHSDWCRQQVELRYPGNDALAFAALMHDAHEFILGDVPTPLKNIMPEYEHVANKLQNAITSRYGGRLTNETAEIIAAVDKEALEWEWENKVLRKSGFVYNDFTAAQIWIENFKRLCKQPHVI